MMNLREHSKAFRGLDLYGKIGCSLHLSVDKYICIFQFSYHVTSQLL